MNRAPTFLTFGAFALLLTATRLSAQSEDATATAPTGFTNASFEVKYNAGAIVGLKQPGDTVDYLNRSRWGDVNIRYRQGQGPWQTVQSARLYDPAKATVSADASGFGFTGQATNADGPVLGVEMKFNVNSADITWSMTMRNLTANALEIGDLSVPVSVGARGARGGGGGRGARGGTNQPAPAAGPVVLKHSFISGTGSYFFWMRSDLKGDYLAMLPTGDTSLEYWEPGGRGGGGGYQVFIHSKAAGAAAAAGGTKWRQPNTSLTLAAKGSAGDARTYGFKFRWAGGYDAVRQMIVDEGKIDFQIVPGMTIPTDLDAKIAMGTWKPIQSVDAEFPAQTKIQSLGTKGSEHLYDVHFAKLGENRLKVNYGNGEHVYLEFFATEPVETLIKKRAAFLAKSQHRDTNKWYNGLITEWNMASKVLLSPENYDLIRGFRIYDVTCDDAGLGRPAYLAAKNAEYPDQKEIEAMDYYIKNFVWGGLQRTTEETRSYGVYGIPDWKTNRMLTNGQPKIGRQYDYPHVILMYFSMYRIAHNYPEIKMYLTAKEYLQRAYGTATAMRGGNSTGFYNELVIPDVVDALYANGMTKEGDTLRDLWERKVKNFVNREQNLFQSEYAFDSTGFESTAAFAKYALEHADGAGGRDINITSTNAQRFLEKQLAANLFCRGVLEPAYYLLGSDYRSGGGNSYTLSYMAQMGGWGVLDYAYYDATNPAPYLRSGMQSSLSAWALVNSGTAESDYGYWYHGQANDGGAGGGFEPAPFGQTWLGMQHHRGSWFYGCEEDLGFSAGIRDAATVITDDPIFGRIALCGDLATKSANLLITPKDGVRRRFHAMLDNGKLHLLLDNDRFRAGQPITLRDDLAQIAFTLESDDSQKHDAVARLTVPTSGDYTIRGNGNFSTTVKLTSGKEEMVKLPITSRSGEFTIARATTR